jgi:putative colanic acid biosynthesis UDP-glucose lipid carrier transferase
MEGFNRYIKAFEDRVLAFFILILISPLLAVIAIGVKLTSPGPVLFKQLRHGWDGKPIKVYKFRTMVLHAEENGRVTQARKNDDRITPFGAFLRRTSLDELPQFFNVLQGRMSIVGPRPHAIAHNDEYKDQIDEYMLRHKVKPGITGWAQVNGWRGETDTLEKMQKRIEYDLYYIDHWSLWFDIKIIVLTLFKGFVGNNAY